MKLKKLKFPKVLKDKRLLIILALIIIISAYGLTQLETISLPGGNIWQMNYEWGSLRIVLPDETTYTYTSVEQMDVPSTITSWVIDPDGAIRTDNSSGFLCGVRTDVSLLGRVDSEGNSIDYNATDPNQIIIEDEANRYYKYFYRFEAKIETVQDLINILHSTVCEVGDYSVEARIQLNLQKSIFNNNVSAYFADASIDSVEVTRIEDYVFLVHPTVIQMNDPGSAVPFSDIVRNEYGDESGILTIGATRLRPGVVLVEAPSPLNFFRTVLGPYPVFVTYKIKVALLAAEPLIVGNETDITPFQPPPPPFIPWWGGIPGLGAPPGINWVLIVVVIVIVLLIICFIRWGKPKEWIR